MQIFDESILRESLPHLMTPGTCAELRAIDAENTKGERFSSISGVFDKASTLVASLEQIAKTPAIYITLNPVDPSRRTNKLASVKRGGATSKEYILRRTKILIDFDAVRRDANGQPLKDQKVSTTDAEHQATLDLGEEAACILEAEGCSEIFIADSGNGCHLIIHVDLPTDDDGLVCRFLKAASKRFSTDGVRVDTVVFDAPRITKLIGTRAAKGENTAERPWRMSRTIRVPKEVQITPRAFLVSFAATIPVEPEREVQERSPDQGNRPGDIFNERADWDDDVLGPFGCKLEQSHNVIYVTRPGKSSGVSGTIGYCETANRKDMLYFFTDAPEIAPLLPNKSYTKFEAFTVLKFDADFSAATSWARANGYISDEERDDLSAFDCDDECTVPPASLAESRYKPFPAHVLPLHLSDFVESAAKAISCDASFIALPSLAFIARAIGRKRTLSPKRDWEAPCIVWTVFLGDSGTFKSPALRAAKRYLRDVERRAINEAKAAALQERRDRDALVEGDKPEKSTKPEKLPPLPRYLIDDATTEAIAVLQQHSFDGLVMSRDELSGFLNSFNQYKGGQGGDRSFWLSAFNGLDATVDRKTGEVKFVYISHNYISITGGIQPSVFKDIIVREGGTKDGLCQRFLFAMPPAPIKVVWSEAVVTEEVHKQMATLYERLGQLETEFDGEEQRSTVMTFSREAKPLWEKRYNEFRDRICELGRAGHSILAETYTKLEDYTVRLSLIIELCKWAMGNGSDREVSRGSLESAIVLVDWFAYEARRVISMLGETSEEKAKSDLLIFARLTNLSHR